MNELSQYELFMKLKHTLKYALYFSTDISLSFSIGSRTDIDDT